MMNKSTSGFTLVELIVSIAAGALVMGAALSFLLMGMRMQSRSYETASQQNAVRVVMTLVENLATEGSIGKVQESTDDTDDDWCIYDNNDPPAVLLKYIKAEKSVYVGGDVIMSDVKSSTAKLDGNRLLTITITTAHSTYTTSVYCRVGEIANQPQQASVMMFAAPKRVSPEDGRTEFLALLSDQIGSTGEISGSFEYFSEWYIRQQYEVTPFGGDEEWNENTPWCACFISWAAAQIGEEYLDTVPYFANVSNGAEEFKNTGGWQSFDYIPAPGDLIFFNLDNDSEPDHVGAVLSVDDGMIRVIEGNSGDEHDVKIKEYSGESAEILGYGVLDWKNAG